MLLSLSWPQDASISLPRRRRMVAFMPRSQSIWRNLSAPFLSGASNPVSSTLLSIIRLMWLGPLIPFLRRAARAFASYSLSFSPEIRVYSKDTRLPVSSKYSRQAESSSAMGYFLFTGIRDERRVSFDAWREMERVTGRPSFASLLIPGTRPQVETEIWRRPILWPF